MKVLNDCFLSLKREEIALMISMLDSLADSATSLEIGACGVPLTTIANLLNKLKRAEKKVNKDFYDSINREFCLHSECYENESGCSLTED